MKKNLLLIIISIILIILLIVLYFYRVESEEVVENIKTAVVVTSDDGSTIVDKTTEPIVETTESTTVETLETTEVIEETTAEAIIKEAPPIIENKVDLDLESEQIFYPDDYKKITDVIFEDRTKDIINTPAIIDLDIINNYIYDSNLKLELNKNYLLIYLNLADKEMQDYIINLNKSYMSEPILNYNVIVFTPNTINQSELLKYISDNNIIFSILSDSDYYLKTSLKIEKLPSFLFINEEGLIYDNYLKLLDLAEIKRIIEN